MALMPEAWQLVGYVLITWVTVSPKHMGYSFGMSWNTQTPMSQRTKMIIDHESGGYSESALGRRYGVSRKTVRKWIARFAQEQWAGLEDRSRAPHLQAGAVSEKMEAKVLALKKQWPLWGAPKLHHKLQGMVGAAECPCESTVSNILRRHGLTKPPGRRRIRGQSAPVGYGLRPNECWCADFKGWWWMGNGRRCDPLTITDASSRYLIRCQGMSGSTARNMVQPVFIAAFREYGMPEAIRTDNGPPFASTGLCGLSRLSVWWLKLGIRLERIEPGHPEQNGRHERMHRTLKEAIGEPARHLRAQQVVLDEFRQEYNEERPHEALGFGVPSAYYQASPKQWSEKLPEPMTYCEEWETRGVWPSGQIKWKGRSIHVSEALAGERIGLKPEGDGLWHVYYGTMCLGRFDERKKHLQALRPKKAPLGEPELLGGLGSSPSLRSAQNPSHPRVSRAK